MAKNHKELKLNKYKLPYHWIRDPLDKYSLPYFGYIKIILDNLPQPPALILDAGCGDGRISSEICKRDYTLIGIDNLDISIKYANLLVSKGKFYVSDLRQDLIKIKIFKKNQFDVVILIEVYEHIPTNDCHKVLDNIYKLLKPNGLLIISAPSKLLPKSKLHYRHFSRKEFEKEIQSRTFKIQKTIFQDRIDKVTNFIFSNQIENLLNNKFIQPVFLKRLRRKWYMKYGNITKNENKCGRFIIIAKK